MATIYAADTQKLIEEAAKELEKLDEMKAPEWAGYVKTGHFKQRPPVQANWWYMRAAAILRSVYKLGPIGTNKLRAKYGGKKNRGVRPEHAFKGSGSIIRKVLQQLEKAELIAKTAKGNHKGRVVTGKGKSLLDKIATKLYQDDLKNKKAAAKEAPKEASAPKPEHKKPVKEEKEQPATEQK